MIDNDPAVDPRRGERPEGHPPLDCFLGVPLYAGQDMVGLMGVANRPGGYDEAIVGFLEPLTNACGSVIAAVQADAQQASVEAELRATVGRLNAAERHAHLGSWEVDVATDEMIASDEALDIFGQPPGAHVTRKMFLDALLDEDREQVKATVDFDPGQPLDRVFDRVPHQSPPTWCPPDFRQGRGRTGAGWLGGPAARRRPGHH